MSNDLTYSVEDSAVDAAIRSVVAENPGYVYSGKYDELSGLTRCRYVYNEVPDCGIGKMLFKLGVPVERLKQADDGNGTTAVNLMTALGFSGMAAEACNMFQGTQDLSISWDQALQSYDKVLQAWAEDEYDDDDNDEYDELS